MCRPLSPAQGAKSPSADFSSVAEEALAMATLTVSLLSLRLSGGEAQAQAQALPALQSSRRSSTRALCSVSRVGGGARRLAVSRDDDTSSLRTEESCSGRSGEEVRSSGLVMRVSGASALAAVASLASAGASLADEVAASAVDGDVGISTTVSVLFVVATVGLVVLTGGVVYLGLTEFLEKRALQEDQKKTEAKQAAKKEKSAKQTVKAAARTGGPKGFGSGSRDAAKGDE